MQRSRPDEDAVRDRLRERPGPHPTGGGDDASGAVPLAGDDRTAGLEADVEPADHGPVEHAEPAGDAEEPDTAPSEALETPSDLEEAEHRRDEYLALAQRTQADFDNYRKRAAKDVAAAGARAKASLVRELLPAVDNLERAHAAAGEAEQELARGVSLVHAELMGALRRSGIEPFDPAGERFDPVEHEAISTRGEQGVEAGIVLDVVQKGYRSGESVLRPARVVVSA